MALNATTLSSALRSALLAKPNGLGHLNAQDNNALTELCDAIAATVVAHITANAVVLPTALIAPGGMSPAPVTGTGTIT